MASKIFDEKFLEVVREKKIAIEFEKGSISAGEGGCWSKVVFDRVNLSEKDLFLAHVSFVVFRHCDFSGMKLDSLRLLNVQFERCTFNDTVFNDAVLDNVEFSNCSFNDCKINSKEGIVSFLKCDLSNVEIIGKAYIKQVHDCDINNVAFMCNLSDASFQSSTLKDVLLESEETAEISFYGCDIRESDFSDAIIDAKHINYCSLNGVVNLNIVQSENIV